MSIASSHLLTQFKPNDKRERKTKIVLVWLPGCRASVWLLCLAAFQCLKNIVVYVPACWREDAYMVLIQFPSF